MILINRKDAKRLYKAILLLCLLLWLGFNTVLYAQTMRFAARQFIDANGDTLNYRISTPDYNLSRNYPVVIFLHGSGERGNDNISQLKWGVQNFVTDKMMMAHPAIVIAPQCPGNEHWSNYTPDTLHKVIRLNPKPSLPMKLTMELLDTLIADMPVDTSRIYITGLSMGGYGTYDAIERWPNRFAAAVPVAGAGDPTLANRIAHIPIWDFHGADDPIVNPVYSRKMMNALLKAGAHPGFTEYPGIGHFSWVPAYSNPQVLDWMFRQCKTK
ncbi:MAG TPA: alpha/beta hydrolase-fold protein [Balneolales bacterium]|nr:alpha/beta hydrolase-fold protein [Balneolales bacterium]